MSRSVNFLISSSGRRGALVEILREAIHLHGRGGQVYAVDCSELTAAGWMADGLDIVPPVRDPGFVDAMLEVCVRRDITHLVPTIDPELVILAANRERFRAVGTTVWVSSPETVVIAQDKRRTAHWLDEHDFPRVRQLDLTDPKSRTELAFPVIVKPAVGSSSSGVRVIETLDQLNALDPGEGYLVEEIAPGDEFTVDVLVDSQGRCRSVVPRKRLETRAGEVSKARTTRDPQMISLVTEIAEALPAAYGVLNVQVFRDAAGTFNVIEINARFGGGFPLTWAAGARMPLWLLQEASGEDPSASLEWLEDQVMLRYDAAVMLDRRRP